MKTVITIPDAIFKRADRLAKRLKLSRSELYAEAVREYTDRHEDSEITESYNLMADDMGDDDFAFVSEATRRTLERVEW